MSDQLSQRAFLKQNPEYAEALREINHAHAYAAQMVKAGKLTRQEAEDFEAYLHQQELDALPVDEFHEMMKDGRLEQLQALAGHDGTRDVGDVGDARKAVVNKVKADALDDAWLSQRIGAEHYSRESRNLEASEDLDNRMNDGDFDGAAAEAFASQNDVPSHEADLNAYLDKTYGGNRSGRDESTEKTPGKVVRDHEYDPKKTIQENLADHIGDPAPRPSAVDANGIIDLDILADEGV